MSPISDKTGRAAEKEPALYSSHGRGVRCQHCGGTSFTLRHILMNTPGLTFFGLDWANRTAYALVCGQCTAVQWFLEQPERQ